MPELSVKIDDLMGFLQSNISGSTVSKDTKTQFTVRVQSKVNDERIEELLRSFAKTNNLTVENDRGNMPLSFTMRSKDQGVTGWRAVWVTNASAGQEGDNREVVVSMINPSRKKLADFL